MKPRIAYTVLAAILTAAPAVWASVPDELLTYAVSRCDPVKLKDALANGANPNKTVLGVPALIRCIGKSDMVIPLLEAGADPNVTRGKHNEPALAIAAKSANSRIVKRLLVKGADPNAADATGRTAVSVAAERRDAWHILKSLLDHGGKADMRDRSGQTPMMLAARRGYAGQLELLLARGADPDSVDNQGQSALYYAIRNGHVGTVQALIRAGANLELRARGNGRTPLMTAAMSNQFLIVNELLLAGADKKAQDKSGKTAHDLAEDAKHFRLAEVLKP